jgi:hypothetical protein
MQAQVPKNDLFPASLMKKEKVKDIFVYETTINDPKSQAGFDNEIRLVKKVIQKITFNNDGTISQKEWLNDQGEVQRIWTVEYNNPDEIKAEYLRSFIGDYPGQSDLSTTTSTEYTYAGFQKYQSRVVALVSDSKRVVTDSSTFKYGANGKLQVEENYHTLGGAVMRSTKQYDYRGRKITVTTKVEGKELNRDEYELDKAGRIISASFFTEKETSPRMTKSYFYHPFGWLQEITFDRNPAFFSDGQELELSRKNRYDDAGKLMEIQLDYSDGRRVFQIFDYSYQVK